MNAPYDKPKSREWNVNSPNLAPDQNGQPANKANAMLKSANGQRIGLFVNEIVTDFNLAGSVAQSSSKQQFFPRNYAAPRVQISGQAPNGYEYGRLAEVVRASHLQAIDDGDRGLDDQFRAVTFMTFGKRHVPQFGEAGANQRARQGRKSRTTKGIPSRIVLDGYITNMVRGAERHLVVYDWQFEFVVLRASSMIGLPDSALNRDLVKTVQTIEDALSKAKTATPSVDPWAAYKESYNVAGSGDIED
jgi:hypothetical protein